MVLIDMPMPSCCEYCPCSYSVREGEYEGELMCEAIESSYVSGTTEEITAKSLVDILSRSRPKQCPIVCEIVEKRKKEQGQR